MNLAETLRHIGGRLGLVKVIDADCDATGAPCKITTRTVSMNDLASEVKAEEVRTLASQPAELTVPFDQIFQAAGIKIAEHGWTIERLSALLHTDQYKSMDRSSIQKAVLGLLSTEKVQVEEIVKDAVSRDHSIDAYETFARQKMTDREAARQRKITDLQAQIKALQDECAKQAEEAKTDQREWSAWIDRKIACERDMAWALGFLLDKPIISITQPEGRA